jgi:hypothetical protein
VGPPPPFVVGVRFASRVTHTSCCQRKRLDFLKFFRFLNFKAFRNRAHFGWLNVNNK